MHTSLLEALIGMLDFQAARYLVEHDVAGPAGNDHPYLAPMGTFPAEDGPVNIAASSNRQFSALCTALGCEELLGDERFASARDRGRHRHELNRVIAERTRQQPVAHWIRRLNEAGIPCGPINRIDQAFDDPQVKHLGIAVPLEHPALGTIELVGQPAHLERTPAQLRHTAPEAGEHNDEILAELGLRTGEISELRRQGVI